MRHYQLGWSQKTVIHGRSSEFDAERISANVSAAETDDLLDRVTAFRKGMEPEAVDIIENELGRRGIGPREIEAYGEERRAEIIFHPDGVAASCSFCRRPAVKQGWDWHRLWKVLPVFPRCFYYCKEHQ